MKRNGHNSGIRKAAVLRHALALVLLVSAGTPTLAAAQDSEPSVNEYRLPSPATTPRVRAQGPVDPENPAADAPVARAVEPTTTPTARAAAAPGSPPAAAPQARPRPAASALASPRPATAARTASPAATLSVAASPAPAPVSAITPAASPSAATPAALPAVATTPAVEWRVHSATESPTDQAVNWWPWLAGLMIAMVAVIILALRAHLRRRQAKDDPVFGWELNEEKPAAPPIAEPVDSAPALSPEKPETVFPPSADNRAPAPSPPVSRPALGVLINPLDVALAARRLSATLLNIVLNFELTVSNNGESPIGPIIVGGDMIGAHASLPKSAQLEIGGQQIDVLHRFPSLAPGESATVTGEFKLALAEITPIRNGSVALFIPLARFRVEAARADAPPLVLSSAFVVGEDQEVPGAALRPFRLDLGPRLYSRIGQRALALSA